MRISKLIDDLSEILGSEGDIDFKVRHNHMLYSVADNTLAINPALKYVSIGVHLIPDSREKEQGGI